MVAAAVGGAVAEAEAVEEAVVAAEVEEAAAAEEAAQLACPRRKSRVAASRSPSVWLSLHSRPPRTPRGARVSKFCGWSTCHAV